MTFLRPIIRRYEGSYKYGHTDALVRTSNFEDIIVPTYLNLDFFTAQCSNYTLQAYRNFSEKEALIMHALSAYGYSQIGISIYNPAEAARKFGFMTTPDQKLSSILISSAMTSGIYDLILNTNITAFKSWGTIQPKEQGYSFDELYQEDRNGILLECLKKRMAQCTFEDAIRELVAQVTVPLTWCTARPEYNPDPNLESFLRLIEIMLAFQFLPQRCKFAGAPLATTLYDLFHILWRVEFNTFVATYGCYNLEPNTRQPVDDEAYWSNSMVPSIYLIIAQRIQVRGRIGEVLRLITPECDPLTHDAAERACFPRVLKNTISYCPYSTATEGGPDTSPFKERIHDIIEFGKVIMRDWCDGTSESKPTKHTMIRFFDNMGAAMHHHGLGFGREIRIPLYHLRNRQTMVMDPFDGRLGTPFPPQMVVCSESDTRKFVKLSVIRRQKYENLFDTRVVWQLIYGISFPSLELDTLDKTNTNVCRFNAPDPGKELMMDNEIFSICENTTMPFGLASMLVNDELDCAGMRTVKDLIGHSLIRKSDFNALTNFIQNNFLKGEVVRNCFGIGKSTSSVLRDDSMDLRITDPILRYLNPDGDVKTRVEDTDPECLKSRPYLVDQAFLQRFTLALNTLGDPDSAYCPIRKGIVIFKRESVHLNPMDMLPASDWPIEIGFSVDHLVIERAENVSYAIYQVGGVSYTNPETYPYRTFIIRQISELTIQMITILSNGIVNGRFRVELPNQVFGFRIIPAMRERAAKAIPDIVGMLSNDEGKFMVINFWDTEIYSHSVNYYMPTIPKLTRWFWPMEAINTQVVCRGLFSNDNNTPPFFYPPADTVCQSGRVLSNGHIIYDTNIGKNVYNLSLTNPVLAVTRVADFTGEIVYNYEPKKYLS
jgi:hypothetical protein